MRHSYLTTPATKPKSSEIELAEIAINFNDRTLWTKDSTNTVIQVGGLGAVGGSNDRIFYENDLIVTTDYTISTGKSAMSTGPITVSDGITVTIPDGSRWVVL